MNEKDLEQLYKIQESTKHIPIIVIENNVIHPSFVIPLTGLEIPINEQTLLNAQENHDGYFVITTKIESQVPATNNLIYKIGTLCQITNLKKENGVIHLDYQSLFKYRIDTLDIKNNKRKDIRMAEGELLTEDILLEITNDIYEAYTETFYKFSHYLEELKPKVFNEYKNSFLAHPDNLSPFELIGFCFAHINMNVQMKQSILENDNVKESLYILNEVMTISLNVKNNFNIPKNSTSHLEKFMKNSPVHNNNQISEEEEDFIQKINDREFPEEVKKIVKRELKRMTSMSPNSSEYHSIENYLNTLYEFPWNELTEEVIDLEKTEKTLDKEHFGMSLVKNRILRQLATYKLTKKSTGTIICLHGPPGVGKTSICKSIADSLNRKYIRIGLGGVSDEAEIRGHRKTYVGAMPGKIVNALLKSKVKNPLIVLDEIDKVGKNNFKGSVDAALLEVLDPEQNDNFNDHFMNTPVDLSEVLFITTANDISRISRPLRDRMEIIHVDSYTPQEKFKIAKNHLVPKEKERLGLGKYYIKIQDSALKELVSSYTREAGVRSLKKHIASIYQNCGEKILRKNLKKININKTNLQEFLDVKPIGKDSKVLSHIPGVINGLAWTPVGGEVLLVESISHKGSGKISITGKLGDVMKESAQIALSLIKVISEDKDIDFDFTSNDIHIHFPAGAVPKDGPSAGITLLSSLYSLISKKKAKKNIAMTGEISLRGDILPVGGIKEKILAAYKEGIKEVFIPKNNERDLDDLPEDILNDKKFVVSLVGNYKDVLEKLF